MLPLAILLAIPFQLQLVGLGAFTFVVWCFVLRKYRNLGLRMFFLSSTVATMAAYWLNESMEQNGQLLYALPIFFVVVGLLFGFICRKYEVGIHKETGNEHLERDGKISLDAKLNSTARTLKRLNIVSKLV